MKSFATRTTIQATPDAIWRLLTDGPGHPAWNTTVTRVDGRVALGEKVTVHAAIAPGRAFPVKVVAFEPPTRMVWSGGMPLGLFKGSGPTSCGHAARVWNLRCARRYTGLLAPLVTRSIPDLQPAFDEFAACLKARAERS